MINLEDKYYSLIFIGLLSLTACGGGQPQEPASTTQTNTTTVPTVNNSGTTSIPASKILVTLSWAPGTTGTGITTGYYVYHGIQSGALTQRIDVGNVTSIQINGNDFGYTGPGRYYFSVNAHDQAGTQSLPSPEIMVNIQP